jgi:phosphatidylglycerophosphate synthase
VERKAYYWINAITLYRLLAAPVLIALVIFRNEEVFRWLLAISFFTDMIDGYLARKYKVASVAGAKLDSIADDLTIIAGLTGLFVFRPEFISDQKIILYTLLGLFIGQNIVAFARYGRITSFHTYLAKLSALLQGVFLILMFFLPKPLYILFYSAAVVTSLELVEEIILTLMLKKWRTNVKGLYWLYREKAKTE